MTAEPHASPSTAEVDVLIAQLTELVDGLGNDLYDLENNNPTRTILATAPLSGRTAALVAEANDDVALVWALYGPAREALTGVVEARGSRPTLNRSQIDHLSQLLSSSVEVPVEAIDLAQRLLPGRPLLTSPAGLNRVVDTLSWAYEQAATRFEQVTRVWDAVLPRLADEEAALAQVERAAETAGGRVPNEISISRRALDELRQTARTDPLSIEPSTVDRLAESVARASQLLADADQRALDVDEQAATIGGRLDRLDDLLADTERRRRDVAEKILSAPEPRSTDEVRAQLAALRAEWDRTLDLTDDGGGQRAAKVARCDRRSQALEDQVQALHDAAGGELADRDELRGRLDAYRAKAYSLGRGEDAELDEVYRRARDVLYQAPCDLVQARGAVERYQQAVSRPGRGEDR